MIGHGFPSIPTMLAAIYTTGVTMHNLNFQKTPPKKGGWFHV